MMDRVLGDRGFLSALPFPVNEHPRKNVLLQVEIVELRPNHCKGLGRVKEKTCDDNGDNRDPSPHGLVSVSFRLDKTSP